MSTAILPAALLALSTLPVAAEAPVAAATGERLSSTQIESMLSARGSLPPNCWVEWIMGQCGGVICDEGGVWVLYDCEDFGL